MRGSAHQTGHDYHWHQSCYTFRGDNDHLVAVIVDQWKLTHLSNRNFSNSPSYLSCGYLGLPAAPRKQSLRAGSYLRPTMGTEWTELIFMTTALCGIIALFLHHLGRLQLYIKAAKFPGPTALPVIGNAHYFIGRSDEILAKVMELVNTYSSPARIWLGHRLFIVVSDPAQIKTVFYSPYTLEKENMYKFIRPWLGTGLITAPANKWRIHRKLIAPTFNTRVLESFVKTFVRHATVMTKQMEKELEAGEFDIHHYTTRCFLDIVCETVMGVKMNSQGQHSRYANAVAGASETITKRFFHFWLHPDLIFNLTKSGRDQREYLKYLHGVTNDIIQMKKSSYNNKTRVANESEHERPATRKAFLDLLIELSDDDTKLTDVELREEVDTMMIAGFHSSAALTTFTAVMLANNPEVQERAYRELCDIYGDQVTSETPVKNEDINRMEYLERVIKETLRLFPIVPMLLREISEDLDIGEYTLPKGASVCVAILNIHRSEKYWPDPLKFDPDRFLPEEVAKRNPFCYIPFSAGPRNCIGQKYETMVVKVVLATVLRRYVLKRDTTLDILDIKLEADLLKPTKIMAIRISERINENVER